MDDVNLRGFVAGPVWDWSGQSGGDESRAKCEIYAGMIRDAMASHEPSGALRGADALLDSESGVVSARGVAELAGALVRNYLTVVVESAPESAPGDASVSSHDAPTRYEGVGLFP